MRESGEVCEELRYVHEMRGFVGDLSAWVRV